MAKFEKAFEMTKRNEGFYSNDPDDPGGETFMGIARNFHPDWEGWDIIDKHKDAEGNLKLPDYQIDNMRTKVKRFFEIKFWIKSGADRVSSQVIANELFDSAVNLSPHKAIKFLQQSLNVLNRNQKKYADIHVDGIFGNTTLMILETCLEVEQDNEDMLEMTMNMAQGKYYFDNCIENTEKEDFWRGWLKRSQAKEHPKYRGKDR